MQDKSGGADIYNRFYNYGFYPVKTDPVLLKYKDDIKDFGYISWGYDTVKLSDRANLVSKNTKMRAISPSTFFDDALTYHWTD